MIDNSELVDAIDELRATATPAVLDWTQKMAKAAASYAKKGGTAEDVAGFEALRDLARVVAESGK